MLQNDNHSTPSQNLYSDIHFSTRITTYANRIIELEILILINQFIISCLSLFFGNICMAGIRMISITKNEAICRGRDFVKTVSIISFYYLHDSDPVNRGKPQCNSEMVQSRDIWIVFSISGNYAYIPLYPSQWHLIRNGFLKIKRFLQLRITTKSEHSIYDHFTLLNTAVYRHVPTSVCIWHD